jgi:hypothetical protein
MKLENIRKLKEDAMTNEQVVIKGIKRYLYYNYSIFELVEGMIEESVNSIEKLKIDMEDKPKEESRKGRVMTFFKSALNIKEEKAPATFKFSKIKRVPLELQEKVSQLISSTPFEKLMLLDVSRKKIEISNASEYRSTQNKMFREEAEKKSIDLILQFNNIVLAMGTSPLTRRQPRRDPQPDLLLGEGGLEGLLLPAAGAGRVPPARQAQGVPLGRARRAARPGRPAAASAQ